MKICYDEISRIYDQVRSEEKEILEAFLRGADLDADSVILDIGCGTGNYAHALRALTGAAVYGLDSSAGMLAKAGAKDDQLILAPGLATAMPYAGKSFSFVYMTDVIHHIPDIDLLFQEIFRVLRSRGKACIATQSHRQIDLRYMSEFFPATAAADKQRYPDIPQIVAAAGQAGLQHCQTEIVGEGRAVKLGNAYIELLEKKGYSMLHLIDECDYQQGMEKVRRVMAGGSITRNAAGMTLVWLEKMK